MKKFILLSFATVFFSLLLFAQSKEAAATTDKKVEKPQAQYIYHKVKKGETVTGIARQYSVSSEEIFLLNPGSKDQVWAGATLRIPNPDYKTGKEIEDDSLAIQSHLEEFIEQAKAIAATPVGNNLDIKGVSRDLNALNNKWNVYYAAKQQYIADNEALLEMVSKYKQICQDTQDSLAAEQGKLDLVANFSKADKFIAAQKMVYQDYTKQATALSLTAALEPKLKELKAKEQLTFADIQKNYEAAKAAAAQNSALAKQMEVITANYIDLKSQSEQIQAAAYKPFFQRIKDYLFGLAAVTIILMFASMAQAKLKAFREMKKNAKKMEQMRRQTDNQYPTI